MAIVIQMPKLGHTMTEGKVLKWHKRQGEPVREGEAVLTIETDKTEVEIESPGAGVMGEQSAAEGEVVAVGARLGVIEQAGTASAAATSAGLAPASVASPAAAARLSAVVPARGASRALASPRAKKLAAQSGIDLATINGSGANGLVTEDDVNRAIASRRAAAASDRSAAERPARGRRRHSRRGDVRSLPAFRQSAPAT